MDYTELITSEHRQKPKFEAMVDLVAGAFWGARNFLEGLPDAFDLDTAIGAQLDAVGEWVGLSRYVSVPITGVYFSLDIAGLGLDEGYLQGRYDSTTGPVRMNDEVYRAMLRAKIGANHWDGTSEGLNAILASVLVDIGAQMFVEDHQDMTMSLYLIGAVPQPIYISLIKGGYMAVKPAGVGIVDYFRPSENIDGPLFGLDAQGQYIAGLDSGYLAEPL